MLGGERERTGRGENRGHKIKVCFCDLDGRTIEKEKVVFLFSKKL